MDIKFEIKKKIEDQEMNDLRDICRIKRIRRIRNVKDKMGRGKPKKRWLEGVKDLLIRNGISINEGNWRTLNRVTWRKAYIRLSFKSYKPINNVMLTMHYMVSQIDCNYLCIPEL